MQKSIGKLDQVVSDSMVSVDKSLSNMMDDKVTLMEDLKSTQQPNIIKAKLTS